MATKRSELLRRLATARQVRAENVVAKKRAVTAPKTVVEKPVTPGISDAERHLAKKVADHAMIAGWERAIVKMAYEERISTQRIEQILDDAAYYNDKADPSGRIDELEDWKREKQGRSVRMAPKRL